MAESSAGQRRRLVQALAALTFVQLSISAYNVLAKSATDAGMDPGVLVLTRDSTTATICIFACRVATGSWSALLPRQEHRLSFVVLGLFGVYFGQYFNVVGLAEGTAVLSAVWQNTSPAATYVLGVALGTERLGANGVTALKVVGVTAAVAGTVVSSLGAAQRSDSERMTGLFGASGVAHNAAFASVFFALAVLFGGAGFYHLQKRLLREGYAPIQVVAWFYATGVFELALVLLPHALDAAMWRLNQADAVAIGLGMCLWPLLAYLLAYANDRASPVIVMALSPLQILGTMVLDYAMHGAVPGAEEIAGAAAVASGLALFVAGALWTSSSSRFSPPGSLVAERAKLVDDELGGSSRALD